MCPDIQDELSRFACVRYQPVYHQRTRRQLGKRLLQWARVSNGPAGSNKTSGSWRIQNVNEDSAGITRTWNVSGDEVSMSDPTGDSWQAKVGGGESPVKGIYANETVSVKRLGSRELEITYKRDGKAFVVDKVTVAADGKRMTTVSDNKWLGRTSTYVDEKQ